MVGAQGSRGAGHSIVVGRAPIPCRLPPEPRRRQDAARPPDHALVATRSCGRPTSGRNTANRETQTLDLCSDVKARPRPRLAEPHTSEARRGTSGRADALWAHGPAEGRRTLELDWAPLRASGRRDANRPVAGRYRQAPAPRCGVGPMRRYATRLVDSLVCALMRKVALAGQLEWCSVRNASTMQKQMERGSTMGVHRVQPPRACASPHTRTEVWNCQFRYVPRPDM